MDGSCAGSPPRLCVGGVLDCVVERLELLEAQRAADQPVGEPRVLRQQRAVQVRADDGAAADALGARGARVAVALQDAPERLLAAAEMRVAGMVLESGEDPPATVAVEVDLDRDVADQARAVGADRLEVDEAEAGNLLV